MTGSEDKKKVFARMADVPIDQRVRDIFIRKGIEDLYPPQQRCIEPIFKGENLVLSVPTSAGKSLVAYLAALRAVLDGGRAIYIVPLKALAAEKYQDLLEFSEIGAKVGLFIGDADEPAGSIDRYNLIVATSEKVDSLLRHRTKWLEDLSVVVADEVHLINEPDRGPTLEIVLSRLRQVNKNLQVVALSATIQNSQEIALWLDGKHIQDDFRPVVLHEGVYHEHEIFFIDNKRTKIKPGRSDVFDLMNDTVQGGGQCLVFVNSRKNAESLAAKLGNWLLPKLDDELKGELEELSQQIISGQSERTSLGDSLGLCCRSGVAFHHAGLTSKQRTAVEKAFKKGIIKGLCATPTLAAGINLPARRVIIRDVFRYDSQYGGIRPLPVMEVKQMAGRAGRPHLDPYGEAILIAKNRNQKDEMISEYLLSDTEPIFSKLSAQPALRMHLLGAIATGYVWNVKGLNEFFDTTFYGTQKEVWMLEGEIGNAMDFLKKEGLIVEEDDGSLAATSFGHTTSNLYIDPRSAVILRDSILAYNESKKTNEFALLLSICLTTDMNTLYFREKEIEWLEGFWRLNKEWLLNKAPEDNHFEYEMYLKSVKTAYMLYHWIEETTEEDITERFNIGPGDIRARVEVAQWLLGALNELWKQFSDEPNSILRDLRTRVRYGIEGELVELVSLRGIGRVRSRILQSRGYKDLDSIRTADPAVLAGIRKIGPQLAKSMMEQLGVDIGDDEIEPIPEECEEETDEAQETLTEQDGKQGEEDTKPSGTNSGEEERAGRSVKSAGEERTSPRSSKHTKVKGKPKTSRSKKNQSKKTKKKDSCKQFSLSDFS